MFTLLSPSALWALLGLLVPVAIHLWNRRPGREVAVGSLRWLTAGANRRLRNLKPEQLWLLLLRAALLAVLAVGSAGPVWRQARPAGRGQVLVSPELMGTPAFAALRPTVDSLRRRGYGLRWLAADFPRVSRAAWRADSLGQRDSAQLLAAVNPAGGRFQWARVQQAADAFAGQPLYVLTAGALRGFQGPQPLLPAAVTWQVLPTPAPLETWLQAAAFRGDSLQLLLGESRETQTAFRRVAVRRPPPGGEVRVAGLAFRLETGATGSRLQPVGASALAGDASRLPVPVRARPLRVLLYSTPDFAADARYLHAGLRAAATGLLAPLNLSTTTVPPNPATPPDWLFWLTDKPLPDAWRAAVNAGTTVWREAPGPGTAEKSRLAVAMADEIPVAILRHSAPPANAPAADALWTDGQGRPVLTRRAQGRGAYYQLTTRLAPAWSELADSPALPARLLALLQPDIADATAPAPTAFEQALTALDQRALDPAQVRRSSGAVATRQLAADPPAGAGARPPGFRQTDLRPWLVLVAALLFALERLLARRREGQLLPAAP